MLNVALIIGGLVAIAISIWGKRFYDADAEGMPYRNERVVSPLWGKLVFGLVGIMLFVVGIVNLFHTESFRFASQPPWLPGKS